MPSFCCVINCGSRQERDNIGFYRIPSVLFFQHKERLNELSWIRRTEWLAAINRGDWTDSKLKNARVCSKHFISGKPAKLEDDSNPDWVPSLNMGNTEELREHPKKRYNSKQRASESQLNTENVGENNANFKEEYIVLQSDNCDNFLDDNDKSTGVEEMTHFEIVPKQKPKKPRWSYNGNSSRVIELNNSQSNKNFPRKNSKDEDGEALEIFSKYMVSLMKTLSKRKCDETQLKIVSVIMEAKREDMEEKQALTVEGNDNKEGVL